MSDLKVSIVVGAKLGRAYQRVLDRARRAVQGYGREVGEITRAHAGTGDPLPDAERGYASGEAAAQGYASEVDRVVDTAHAGTGDPLPDAERGYTSGEAAAQGYASEVDRVVDTAHAGTGDPLPDAERGYASGEAAAQGYASQVDRVVDTAHAGTGDPLPDAERGYASGEAAAQGYASQVDRVVDTAHAGTGDPLPDAERGYASGEAAAQGYASQVDRVVDTAHAGTGDPLPDAERGYASGEAAAQGYASQVDRVVDTAHAGTGDPLPDAERGYASGEAAAQGYASQVDRVVDTAHAGTGDPLPDAERGYASGEAAAQGYASQVDRVVDTAHAGTGDPLPDAERGYASGEAAAKAYGTEVGEVTKAHDTLQDEMRETAEQAKRTAQTARDEAQRRKDEAGRQLRETALLGASVIYGFQRLASGALEREEQLLNLRTVLDVDDPDAAIARSLAQARARTRTSLAEEEEILEIEYALNSAGLGEDVARAGTELVHQVAKVTRGSAEQVGEVVGITFNNMAAGMAGTAEEKMQRIGDVLAKTQFRYQIRDFGQLGEGISEAAASATSSRVAFETLAASIGILNSAGQQGGEAGTAFNAVMRSMGKAAEELGFDIERTASGEFDMLANLALIEEGLDGLDIDERSQMLQDIFGDEGRAGIVPLLQGMDALREGIGVMHGARGTVREAYRPFLESRGGRWKMLGQNVKQVGEIFAGTLLPALNSVVEPMVAGAAWVSEMIEEYPHLGRVVGALALGFGIVASGLAVASAATWLFNAALLANPITWVVGAFVVGAALLVTYWEPVSEFFTGLWATITEGARAVGDSIAEYLAPVMDMIEWVTESKWASWIADKVGLSDEPAATPAAGPGADRHPAAAAVVAGALVAGTAAAPAAEPDAALASQWQAVLDARPDITAEREAVDQGAVQSVIGDARAYVDSLADTPAPRADSGLAGLVADLRATPAPGGAAREVNLVFHQTFNIQGASAEIRDEVAREMERVMRRASVEAGLAESDDVF